MNIEHIERHYDAQYVADLCIMLNNGHWSEEPYAVFWQKTPPKREFSHYFGMCVKNQVPYIVNGSSVADGIWEGAEALNGEIIFSRFRHDNRVSADGSAMVDGGRDYLRHRGKTIRLKVIGPDFHIVP